MAFEHGDAEDCQAASKSWKELAEEFWAGTANDDAKKKSQNPKLHRIDPKKC